MVQSKLHITLRSSGVTMTWNVIALSLPNISYDHRLTDRINFTAPMPLLAMRIFSIGLFPPYLWMNSPGVAVWKVKMRYLDYSDRAF